MNAAAQQLGRLGGLAKSKAKAAAVRENGKLGGRPKKQKRRKLTECQCSLRIRLVGDGCAICNPILMEDYLGTKTNDSDHPR